ncbi:hypothetical protein Taro_044150 [Colocasia esculenta]|uniref:Uncharacterized protein n=1 Tax=Colocasia esculenta TaxID=4460 RepID=A0A843X2V7_COLES|nr:hypothetical protein [Colocasia esculenta]
MLFNSYFKNQTSWHRYGTWRTESDGFHVRRPRVRIPVHDRDCLPVYAGRPGDRDRLPVDHTSSASFPFFLTTGYAFTRPEDLPRARAVWESTSQTNLRKSMWEA